MKLLHLREAAERVWVPEEVQKHFVRGEEHASQRVYNQIDPFRRGLRYPQDKVKRQQMPHLG